MLHQIGVGALGPVFRTYEPDRDRLVAVKVFRLDITPEQATALSVELSRAAEASLFHPSIVEPVGAGLEGTLAYRAEEYVAAESLDVAMRHYAPASVDKVLPFITQIASAIDFARSAGFGHGALHPRDIFITPDEARATGFGVVDALDSVGLRAPVRRPYSSPERVAGETWTSAADVYSLAIIAFELLTGRRPSGAGDHMDPLTVATLATSDERVRAVLARATAEHPSDRYPTASAFASALELAWQGEPAPEPRPAERQDEPQAAAALGPLDDGDERRDAVEMPPSKPPRKRETRKRAPVVAPLLHDVAEPTEPQELAAEPDASPVAEIDTVVPLPPSVDDIAPEAVAIVEPLRAIDTLAAPIAANPELVEASTADLPLARDSRERVVAVDEFRAREGAGAAAGRGRPRAPRIAVPTAAQSAPEREPVLFGNLATPDDVSSDRPRFGMLPVAMGVMIGSLLGFALGYVVGGRQAPASPPAATLASADSQRPDQTPGTTGQTPKREWSEQAVAPKAASEPPATAPAVPPESPPAVASSGTTRPPAPARRSGRIVVRSTPAGAAVTVNGEWRGRTPLTLDDLALRSYVVRVVQPGYEVERRDFTLSEKNASRTVTVELRRRPGAARDKTSTTPAPAAQPARPLPGNATGVLYVDSRPTGAKVLVDGKERGTTPLRIPEMSLGMHVVRLELADHQPWTVNAQVVAGETARVTGSLERIR